MFVKALLQLMLSKGIGEVSLKKILKYININSQVSLEAFCGDSSLLRSVLRCSEETVISVRENESNAEKLYNDLQRNEVVVITEIDPIYPEQLKKTLGEKCPPVLFAKGNVALLNNISVGFCGSRKVSEKGIRITEECAEQLVERNITVVSGYAAGTDIAAHSSAMINGGNTIFVLAEGILRYKEKTSVKSYLTEKNHVFVSQFLPNAMWNAGNAMKRNSVIIGLSNAMILVESGKTGGTFAAGEEALKRGEPLFVIDYAKPEVSAEANPYFIERGGHPIRGKNGIPNLEKVFSCVEEFRHSFVQEQLTLNLAN